MRYALGSICLGALCLAACGIGDLGPADDGPDASPGDGGVGCSAFLTFDPEHPVGVSGAVVRANADVTGASPFRTHTWSVSFKGAAIKKTPAQENQSAITFPAEAPGVYFVRLAVGAPEPCPTVQVQLNVRAPGAIKVPMRLRVTPPASKDAPPFEQPIDVYGGADFSLGTTTLDAGVTAVATVKNGGAGVASYLRFQPASAPAAAVEAFTNATGGFSARLQAQPHDVMVIPTSSAYAPWLVKGFTAGTTVLNIGTGTAMIPGKVLGPSGGPLAGAKVQLKIDGIPSTLATTAADGSFTVLTRPAPDPDSLIAVDVTPPAGSGLPRLLAQSTTALKVDANMVPLDIRYSTALAVRDLGGTQVQRTIVGALKGVKVSVVGGVPDAGTVRSMGLTASVSAFGAVLVTAVTDNAGALPPMLAPARQLSAVIEVAADDHAVTAIDLTSGKPTAIDAPREQTVGTQLRGPDGTPIADAVLDVVPAGDLAAAGVVSAIRVRAGANGQVSVPMAIGGHYDLRIHDPVRARGAPRVAPDVTAPTIAGSYALQPAVTAIGTLLLQGSPTPVGGASIQLLCGLCEGLDRSRPLAEGTSQPDGSFAVAVPDPGTN